MKRLLIILVLHSVFCIPHSSAQTKYIIGGRTFSITLHVTGASRPGMEWKSDAISFEGTKLTAKVIGTKEHFPPFDCTFYADSSAKEMKLRFSASGKNNGGSTINWEGTIAGDKIEGTATWTNMHGPETLTFTGKVKGKK